jgi:hypothetical protein
VRSGKSLEESILVFLDTEYTGLSHPAKARQQLSLALVAEDGSTQWPSKITLGRMHVSRDIHNLSSDRDPLNPFVRVFDAILAERKRIHAGSSHQALETVWRLLDLLIIGDPPVTLHPGTSFGIDPPVPACT